MKEILRRRQCVGAERDQCIPHRKASRYTGPVVRIKHSRGGSCTNGLIFFSVERPNSGAFAPKGAPPCSYCNIGDDSHFAGPLTGLTTTLLYLLGWAAAPAACCAAMICSDSSTVSPNLKRIAGGGLHRSETLTKRVLLATAVPCTFLGDCGAAHGFSITRAHACRLSGNQKTGEGARQGTLFHVVGKRASLLGRQPVSRIMRKERGGSQLLSTRFLTATVATKAWVSHPTWFLWVTRVCLHLVSGMLASTELVRFGHNHTLEPSREASNRSLQKPSRPCCSRCSPRVPTVTTTVQGSCEPNKTVRD